MIVAKLIEKLKTFPPSARVVVNGYEGDCDDIKDVNLQPIRALANVKKSMLPLSDSFPADVGMGRHAMSDEASTTEIAVYIRRDGTLR